MALSFKHRQSELINVLSTVKLLAYMRRDSTCCFKLCSCCPFGRSPSSRASESEEPPDESPLLEPFLHELPIPQEDEEGLPLEDRLVPHVIVPAESLELLEKAERKVLKKKRRNKQKKQRHRHFNDLWVRMEER